MIRRRPIALLMTALVLVATRAPAHPFHVTLAEAEVNREKRSLEVALRIYNPIDLEDVLTRRAGRKISLDATPAAELDPLIVDYLRESFSLTRPDGSRPEITWVGKEVSLKTAWLYFELPLGDSTDLEGATLGNRAFFELLPDQANTINLRDGSRRQTLRSTRERAEQAVRWPEAQPESTPR